MLIVLKEELVRKHEEAREGLRNQFSEKLEKIINENQKVDKYWVLGKAKFPKEFEGKVGRVFLEACLEKPPLVTESFLYEIDNRKGCKTLLWMMLPGGILRLPTLNKTISVNQSGASIRSPRKRVAAKKNGRKRE